MNVIIPTLEPEYTVDGQTIVELNVSEINFKQFCDLVDSSTIASNEQASQRKMFRARVKAQVKCKLKVANGSGSVIPMTDTLLNKMPIPHAVRLKDAVNEAMLSGDPENSPKLISNGDGIATSIHLKLGVPIKFQGDKPPITELEFRADVFEDLEDAILADNRVQQIFGLMKIAKPIDGPENLSSLPTWAVEQLSFEDGMFIANQVLPSFMKGQPDL